MLLVGRRASWLALVGAIGTWSGCPDSRHEARTAIGDEPADVGFWVNAMTNLDARQIADPRRVLRSASTPVLILRSQCDYLAWEVTREYRDLLPNATMPAIEDAGHVIPSDQPALYRQAVRAFLLDERLPQDAYTADVAPW
jgi:proline iminopeptidase